MNKDSWQLSDVSQGPPDARRLTGISLTVQPGITALLGASGSGKTSLLNLLVHFETPTAGSISVCRAMRGELFWVPQSYGLWPHLTTKQHLMVVQPERTPAASTANLWLERFDLMDRSDVSACNLSAGQQARLSVARALASNRQWLVMDEPLSNVDSARISSYWQQIARHTQADRNLIFSTHAVDVVLGMAHNVICLQDGCLRYQGSIRELYESPACRDVAEFLGPTNWLEDSGRTWISGDLGNRYAVRPEQLRVQLAEGSPLRVEAWEFLGAIARLRIHHLHQGDTREFLHRPAGQTFRTGDTVRLEVADRMFPEPKRS